MCEFVFHLLCVFFSFINSRVYIRVKQKKCAITFAWMKKTQNIPNHISFHFKLLVLFPLVSLLVLWCNYVKHNFTTSFFSNSRHLFDCIMFAFDLDAVHRIMAPCLVNSMLDFCCYQHLLLEFLCVCVCVSDSIYTQYKRKICAYK